MPPRCRPIASAFAADRQQQAASGRDATSESRSGLVARSCESASVERAVPRRTSGEPGPLGQAWRSSPTLRHDWLGGKAARSTRLASLPAGPPSRPGVTTARLAAGAIARIVAFSSA